MDLKVTPSDFRRWLLSKEKVSRSSADTYVDDVSRFLRFLEHQRLETVDIEKQLTIYFNDEKLKQSYSRRIRAALRFYFSHPEVDFAAKQAATAWLETNVTQFSSSSKEIDVSHVEQLIRAAAERSSEIHKVRNIALIAFLYATGLRLEEVLNLMMAHLKGSRGAYFHSIEDHVSALSRWSEKNETEFAVPLHPDAKTALRYWLLERLKFPGLRGWSEFEHVWTNVVLEPKSKQLATRMSVKNVLRLFETLSAHADLKPPVTPNDVRRLTMRQLEPGLTTIVLVASPPKDNLISLPLEVHDRFVEAGKKIRPLKGLEATLRQSRWQPERPPRVTFEHAKALVEGALSERGVLEAAQGAAFVGFLLGTGLYYEEAAYLFKESIHLDSAVPYFILNYRSKPVIAPLSPLAQVALLTWLSVVGSDLKNQTVSFPQKGTPLWRFQTTNQRTRLNAQAWSLLNRLSKRGNLTFTMNADDFRKLFRDAVAPGLYTNVVVNAHDLGGPWRGVEEFTTSSNEQQQQTSVLHEMQEEVMASDVLNEFTIWYKRRLSEKFQWADLAVNSYHLSFL